MRLKVVPEEFSSFKDMFVSDLRARALQFLTRSHAAVAECDGGTRPAGLSTYLALTAVAAPRPGLGDKRPRGSEGGPVEERLRSPQAFTEIDAVAFNGVVLHVEARHPLSLVLADGHTCVPQQYCSNKAANSLITFGTIFDHVSPFLALTAAEGRRLAALGLRSAEPVPATVLPSVFHTNVFIMGRYRKMVRGLSQSPWFGDGGRIGSFSLQEVIADPVIPLFFPDGVPANPPKPSGTEHSGPTDVPRRCHGRLTGGLASPWQETDPFQKAMASVFGYGRYKFHSAGREDVDVRMLGSGRPFVLEIVDPHRATFGPADLAAMETAVNTSHGGAIEVAGLAFTTADVTVTLARHSESKTKHYRCVVWCGRAIESDNDEQLRRVVQTRDLRIIQRTPLRVLHRRSLLSRPRTIHSVSVERINSHWLVVDLETQAGTYVKEFIHGDNGRTLPNLGMLLGCRTDIIQLDVMGMAMDGHFTTKDHN
jgi:tRNA pseudouridine synthase 10